MATMARFKRDTKKRSEVEVKNSYHNLQSITYKNGKVLNKLSWLEGNFKYLLKIQEPNFTEEIIEEVICPTIGEPYQVTLSRKYLNIYKSATKRGLEFNLTLKDVHNLLKETKCYYTGVYFVAKDPLLAMSVDRVDASLGYVKGNVVACTIVANSLKEQVFEKITKDLGADTKFVYQVALKVLDVLK